MPRFSTPAVFLSLFLMFSLIQSASSAESLLDIEFARVDGTPLKLDLHLPDQKNASLLVWIHGGAWRRGSRSGVPVKSLVDKGWAIASVDYRLSPIAKFPAQIHDIKAAIRFLRAKSREYGYDSERIGILGASAGGHLAALTGVINEVQGLEGSVGNHLEENSSVQAIVSLYGASNLTTILKQSTPHGLGVRKPALDLFIGGQPEEVEETAKMASPVFHVDASDPPLLLIHGDQDPQMPINQSHELHGKYKEHGLDSRFEVIYGGAHGGSRFYDEESISKIDTFLKEHL